MALAARLDGYRLALGTPGTKRLALAYLALSTALTMNPVSLVLFARSATGSYTTAALVLAATTVGSLASDPFRARLVDRLGASRAVGLVIVPDLLTDAAFILAGRLSLGAALVPIALLSGAVSAPAGPALRKLWSTMFDDERARHASYALLAVLAETSFIAGPLLAGAIIGLSSPTAAVAASALLSFAGAAAFATAPRARSLVGIAGPRPRLGALAGAGIRTVLATSLAFGATFGVLDIGFPAYARAEGSAAVSGLLLSAFAAGSWIGGLLYGLHTPSRPPGLRYPPLCLLAAAGLAPLIALPGLGATTVLAALAGLLFAPITNSQVAVIEDVSPPEHRSEAFGWLGTLYGSGVAMGAALGGALIVVSGARLLMAVACVATAIAAGVARLRRRTLERPVSSGRFGSMADP